MSTYMGGRELGRHEATPVNISVPKDPDVCMAQGSFGTHS